MDLTHLTLYGLIAANVIQLSIAFMGNLFHKPEAKANIENNTVNAMASVNTALENENTRLTKRLDRAEWEAEQWKEIALTGSKLVTTATEVAAQRQSAERPHNV